MRVLILLLVADTAVAALDDGSTVTLLPSAPLNTLVTESICDSLSSLAEVTSAIISPRLPANSARNASIVAGNIKSRLFCAMTAMKRCVRLLALASCIIFSIASFFFKDLVELEKNRINAIKAIGVAFGENQQPPADINWIDNRR